MKQLIVILLIVGGLWGAWTLRKYYLEKKAESAHKIYEEDDDQAVPSVVPQQLPGMHYTLETPLTTAQQSGADGLKRFLDQYRPVIRDPRLAWIELDYVTLVGLKDPAQARAIFAEVKKRTPTNSLVYPRIAKLAKTYE